LVTVLTFPNLGQWQPLWKIPQEVSTITPANAANMILVFNISFIALTVIIVPKAPIDAPALSANGSSYSPFRRVKI